MIKRLTNNLIYTEFKESQQKEFFTMKEKKFLHNIDTFYYSIKLKQDFTRDSKDKVVKRFRAYFDYKLKNLDYDSIPFNVPGLDAQLNLMNFTFAGFYNICIECPELYDIFFAPVVPSGENGPVTSEIIVQIRSYMLWQYGATKAFEETYEVVKSILDYFSLDVDEVKENRVDYCWHTNALQDPETYFRIDNFSKMQISRYKRIGYQYALKHNDEYENDYISLGKRSDKCFVRIYLKSKEVVEQGYKPWFLKEWVMNGLINRYDFYCLEKAFIKHSWNYLDKARLEFYLEHGRNAAYKKKIQDILDEKVSISPESLSELADLLTPRVTKVINIEYQTTRRMSKSYCLIPLKDYSGEPETARIYEYLDNRSLITEYLTHSTLRLVNPDTDDSNKSRADYTDFWKCLRRTKMLDVKKAPSDLKLTRDYTRKLNKEIVKKRLISSTISYSLYEKGINDDSVFDDLLHVVTRLNDNDVHAMKRIKDKRIKQFNKQLIDAALDDIPISKFKLLDIETGSLLE